MKHLYLIGGTMGSGKSTVGRLMKQKTAIRKKLSEMSKEELWELFPIVLSAHRTDWKKWYEDELCLLRKILPEEKVWRISHIGSTSVDTIWAKPIVDILVEAAAGCGADCMQTIKEILLQNGYLCMSEDGGRISLNKGYTEEGFAERVYHLHLRRTGDNDELYFRDYLIEHPETAKEYENLKMGLWKQFEHDRDGYTEKKGGFVQKHTLQAKAEFGGRYGDFYIPDKIKEKTGGRNYAQDTVGMSDSRVLLFDDMVLKIERQREEADKEHKMMTWMSGKLPVPKVLCFQQENGINYLLMSRLEGEMLCSDKMMEHPQELVRLLAEGLQMLWNVDITSCPCRNASEDKLLLARRRVESGLCSMEDAEPETYGAGGFESPGKLLEWLEANRPKEQLVFSHGDYCLPNIYTKNGKISGFLDLGRSGAADIYQDIALCYRSLKHNFDGTYGGKPAENFNADILFDVLGLKPDWDKIKYYILLDELF